MFAASDTLSVTWNARASMFTTACTRSRLLSARAATRRRATRERATATGEGNADVRLWPPATTDAGRNGNASTTWHASVHALLLTSPLQPRTPPFPIRRLSPSTALSPTKSRELRNLAFGFLRPPSGHVTGPRAGRKQGRACARTSPS